MIFVSDSQDVIDAVDQANVDYRNWVTDVEQWAADYGDNLQPAIRRIHNNSMVVFGLLTDPQDERNWEKVTVGTVEDGTRLTFWRPIDKTRIGRQITREMASLEFPVPVWPGMPKSWVKTNWETGGKELHHFATHYVNRRVFVEWACDGIDVDESRWSVSSLEELEQARTSVLAQTADG